MRVRGTATRIMADCRVVLLAPDDDRHARVEAERRAGLERMIKVALSRPPHHHPQVWATHLRHKDPEHVQMDWEAYDRLTLQEDRDALRWLNTCVNLDRLRVNSLPVAAPKQQLVISS